MNQDISTLSAIRQVFSGILSIKEHKDTKIPTFELVVGFVFHFIGQAKSLFGSFDFHRAMMALSARRLLNGITVSVFSLALHPILYYSAGSSHDRNHFPRLPLQRE